MVAVRALLLEAGERGRVDPGNHGHVDEVDCGRVILVGAWRVLDLQGLAARAVVAEALDAGGVDGVGEVGGRGQGRDHGVLRRAGVEAGAVEVPEADDGAGDEVAAAVRVVLVHTVLGVA